MALFLFAAQDIFPSFCLLTPHPLGNLQMKGKHGVSCMNEVNHEAIEQMRVIINAVMAPEDSGKTNRSSARTEILIHAIPVFSTRGLERTTVQHLLDAAAVSRRTFYKYFKNKHDVLESIYEIFVENMVHMFRIQAQRAATVNEVIGNTFAIYFDYHFKLGPILRLMAEEARRTESVLWPHRDKAFQSTAQVLQAEMHRVSGRKHELLVFNAIIWALESCSLHVLTNTDCSEPVLAHYRNVMTGIAEAILVDGTSPALLAPQA